MPLTFAINSYVAEILCDDDFSNNFVPIEKLSLGISTLGGTPITAHFESSTVTVAFDKGILRLVDFVRAPFLYATTF